MISKSFQVQDDAIQGPGFATSRPRLHFVLKVNAKAGPH